MFSAVFIQFGAIPIIRYSKTENLLFFHVFTTNSLLSVLLWKQIELTAMHMLCVRVWWTIAENMTALCN